MPGEAGFPACSGVVCHLLVLPAARAARLAAGVSRAVTRCYRDVFWLCREVLCVCFNGSSSSGACGGLNPSGTPLMEVMGEMVSLCLKLRGKKIRRESKQMESKMWISAEGSILSKSPSAKITTLWGKMHFLKTSSVWYFRRNTEGR